MRMKRGDTKPDFIANLTDNDAPVDLTAATAVRVIGKRGTVSAFIDTAPTRDNAAGKVTHLWAAAQTAEVGRIACEIEVTWPGGGVQTFPPGSYLAVDVVDDLG